MDFAELAQVIERHMERSRGWFGRRWKVFGSDQHFVLVLQPNHKTTRGRITIEHQGDDKHPWINMTVVVEDARASAPGKTPFGTITWDGLPMQKALDTLTKRGVRIRRTLEDSQVDLLNKGKVWRRFVIRPDGWKMIVEEVVLVPQ